MSVSAEDFRLAMRRLGGAVTIVSVSDGQQHAGLTATAVTSLSAEPPRLLACINQQGTTFETLSRGRRLAINVLAKQHVALAMRFAGIDGTPETERFDGPGWLDTDLGVKRLEDALVSFVCEVDSIVDVGSHGIVIGNIKDIHLSAEISAGSFDDPLCYLDGNWQTYASLETS